MEEGIKNEEREGNSRKNDVRQKKKIYRWIKENAHEIRSIKKKPIWKK